MGSIPVHETNETKLLVQIIQEKAKWIGGHTFLRYPCENWLLEGYRTITWSQYASAIDKMAFWLDSVLGKSDDTVAYLGPTDARYSIIIPAAIKANRKLFIPDGRVTTQGLQTLLRTTNCFTWLHAEGDEYRAGLECSETLGFHTVPSLEWLLDAGGQKDYSYNKTFDEAKFDTVLIIHTSGTTGTPKPIYHTNGFYSAWGSVHTLSRHHWPRGTLFDAWIGRTILTSCPPQWLGGLHCYIFAPIFMDIATVIPPPSVIGLSPSTFRDILKFNRIHGIHCPPQNIYELYKEPTTLPLLKALDFIIFLGASLDRAIGDDLCEYTRVLPLIGSTEAGPQVDLPPLDKKLWYTHDYAPENGHRMVHIPRSDSPSGGMNNLYELVLDRQADGEPSIYQCAFWNPMFTDLQTVETKELYTPVKDRDGRIRWEFIMRKDDLLKLSWLAKFHAHDIEAHIKAHPDVSGVYVRGEGRPAPFVIIEPRIGVMDRGNPSTLLDELYESVVEANNKDRSSEVKIPKQTVLLAKIEKPFKRNIKSVINKRTVEKDYAAEIETAYQALKRNVA